MKEENATTTQVLTNCKSTKMFKLAKVDDKIRIVMGNYLASEQEFDNVVDAECYVASRPYELILNMILIHNEYEKQMAKEMAKNSQKMV